MYDPYAEFTKTVLPNGLEVHSIFWERPWIGMEIVVHVGGREDTAGLSGIAHFVEHLVSQNIPGHEFKEAQQFFEENGGRTYFGGTSYLATKYRFAIPADKKILQKSLSIFGSMLIDARLEKDIERERRVIEREFNQRYPFLKKFEWEMEAQKVLFRGHPQLETWTRALGRPEEFLKIEKGDLQGFYDKHYVPKNMSLVIVGGFNTEEIIASLIKSPFGVEKSGIRNPIPSAYTICDPTEHEKTIKISDYVSFKTDQGDYNSLWAFPADFPRQARKVFIKMLNEILFHEVREKRSLAYGISSQVVSFQDVCRLEIDGKINPTALGSINELVLECIAMVPQRSDLFQQKLRASIQQLMMIDVSGDELVKEASIDLEIHQRIITIQEIVDNLREVKFEQMAEAAAFLSRDRQYTVISHP